jgi:hypothetical protein
MTRRSFKAVYIGVVHLLSPSYLVIEIVSFVTDNSVLFILD